MPPLVIPSTVQVTCGGNLAGGEVWANVWHVINDDGLEVNTAAADTIANNFRDFYASTADHRVSGWTMNQITVRDISEAGQNVFTPNIVAVQGVRADPPLPYECAIVVTLHTGLNTRRGRGRSFQAGWATTACVKSASGAPILLAAAQTQLATAAQDLLLDSETDGWEVGVASRADSVTRPVTGGYVDNGWDTIRQRSDDIATIRVAFSAPVGP